jgi:hypothetical protein
VLPWKKLTNNRQGKHYSTMLKQPASRLSRSDHEDPEGKPGCYPSFSSKHPKDNPLRNKTSYESKALLLLQEDNVLL